MRDLMHDYIRTSSKPRKVKISFGARSLLLEHRSKPVVADPMQT